LSVSFKFVCSGELEGKESKEYAVKNIMLNLNSIFRKTMEALRQNRLIERKVNMGEV
jgi:hypothetical protein